MANPRESENYLPDRELASLINPLLIELESRMVLRGDGGNASAIAKLRTFVVSKFGIEKKLQAGDTKTAPMFGTASAGVTKQ